MSTGYATEMLVRAEAKLYALLDFVNLTSDQQVIVAGTRVLLPFEVWFESIPKVQSFLDHVAAVREVHGRWSRAYEPLQVRASAKATEAHYKRKKGRIILPEAKSYRELTIIHQYAHHLSRDDHGPQWRAAYTDLVAICLSPESAVTLKACWHDEGLVA